MEVSEIPLLPFWELGSERYEQSAWAQFVFRITRTPKLAALFRTENARLPPFGARARESRKLPGNSGPRSQQLLVDLGIDLCHHQCNRTEDTHHGVLTGNREWRVEPVGDVVRRAVMLKEYFRFVV